MPNAPSPSPRQLLALCWGKARPEIVGGWHPAALHMLDVAAVAVELLHGRVSAALSVDLMNPGGTPLTDADLAVLVALHDLGKVTPGFQAMVDDRRQVMSDAGLQFPDGADRSHGATGLSAFARVLAATGVADELYEPPLAAARAVVSHHGRFVTLSNSWVPNMWQRLQDELVAVLTATLRGDPFVKLATLAHDVNLDPWLTALAGFTSVADWVGSNTDYFCYCPGVDPDRAYFEAARTRARTALDALGFDARPVGVGVGVVAEFADLFPGMSPRPMQSTAIAAAGALDRPGMIIVEAETGGGKTEASLAIAESWCARFGLDGLYYALPTQATANQMFGRVRLFLERTQSLRSNLQLLHGSSEYNEDLRELRIAAVDGPGRTEATVIADGWFRGKRRGLVSRFAVGTVDQAMLAALQAKHFFVRHFGLARKVVVIDEVHAYDAYMSGILCRLLEWLSALGCGVILLSATLPRETLCRLVEAYSGAKPDPPPTPYPRVTGVVAGGRARAVSVPRSGATRVLPIQTDRAPTDLLAKRIAEATAAGGVFGWVCNTVSAAQAAYTALVSAGVGESELVCFHARMPFEDRSARERQVLACLSKDGQRPVRLIVVATQVIEQSLDIDFDGLITELAPIDLMLQRAGRLQRHRSRDANRPPTFREAVLQIRIPDSSSDMPDFGPSGLVYAPYILQRSLDVIRSGNTWSVPDDLDALMDAVYGALPADAPAALVELRAKFEKDKADAERKSRAFLVPVPGGGEDPVVACAPASLDDDPDSPAALRAKTRDIDLSVRLVCLLHDDDRIFLSPNDARSVDLEAREATPALIRRLMERSLSVSSPRLAHELLALAEPALFKNVGVLRGARFLLFDRDGRSLELPELRLDRQLGLVRELP